MNTRRAITASLLAALIILTAGATSGTAQARTPTQGETGRDVAATAQRAAARHFEVTADYLHDVTLESWMAVTWPDGSLGCPQEGMAYTTAEAPGFIITFAHQDRTVNVHASERQAHAIVPSDCAADGKYRTRPDARLDTTKLVRVGGTPIPRDAAATFLVPQDRPARVRVTWDPPEDDTAVLRYRIARDDGQTWEVPPDTHRFTDQSPTPGTDHVYDVTARGTLGPSHPASADPVSMPDVPAALKGATATVEATDQNDRTVTIRLRWSAAAPPASPCRKPLPVTHHTVFRIHGPEQMHEDVRHGAATEHAWTMAAFGAAYRYEIRAHNAMGAGPATAITVWTPRQAGSPAGTFAATP